jgi:hypothetical protein
MAGICWIGLVDRAVEVDTVHPDVSCEADVVEVDRGVS